MSGSVAARSYNVVEEGDSRIMPFKTLMVAHVKLTVNAAVAIHVGDAEAVEKAVKALYAQLEDWEKTMECQSGGHAEVAAVFRGALNEHTDFAASLIKNTLSKPTALSENIERRNEDIKNLGENATRKIKPFLDEHFSTGPEDKGVAKVMQLFMGHLNCTDGYLRALAFSSGGTKQDVAFKRAIRHCVVNGRRFGTALDALVEENAYFNRGVSSEVRARADDYRDDEDEYVDRDTEVYHSRHKGVTNSTGHAMIDSDNDDSSACSVQ